MKNKKPVGLIESIQNDPVQESSTGLTLGQFSGMLMEIQRSSKSNKPVQVKIGARSMLACSDEMFVNWWKHTKLEIIGTKTQLEKVRRRAKKLKLF